MASKRLLKNKVKRIVYEVLDSCDYLVVTNAPSADDADKLMDDVVDFHDATITRINAAKSKKNYSAIVADVNNASKDFTDRLNKME